MANPYEHSRGINKKNRRKIDLAFGIKKYCMLISLTQKSNSKSFDKTKGKQICFPFVLSE
jgi:hypothetical protein